MSYANLKGVPSVTPGVTPVEASQWNTYVRDNFDSLKAGHIVCTSSTRPSPLVAGDEGLMIFETDTDKFLVWDGAAWVAAVGTDDLRDGAVTSAKIADGTIVNADVNASAAIEHSKISGIGLVHLNTTSFSASTGFNLDSIFVADYIHYKIVLNIDSRGGVNRSVYFKWRDSGSTLNFSGTIGGLKNNSFDTVSSLNGRWLIAQSGNAPVSADLDVFNVDSSSNNQVNVVCNTLDSAGRWNIFGIQNSGILSPDGFRIETEDASNNITGSINVYGYRK